MRDSTTSSGSFLDSVRVFSFIASRSMPFVALSVVLILFTIFVAGLSFWNKLPLWAKEIIRYQYSPQSRHDPWSSSATNRRNGFLVQREGILGATRDVRRATTLWKNVKCAFEIVDEYWKVLTADGHRPGLLEVYAFFALMRQVREERRRERDLRFEQDGEFIDSPRKVLSPFMEPCRLVRMLYREDPDRYRKILNQKGMNLLSFANKSSPGTPPYLIASDKNCKIVYVVILGSTSVADFLTNSSTRTLPYNLGGPFIEGGDCAIMAHEGCSLVAKNITNEIQPIVEAFFKDSYKILFVGHSLGGSLACLSSIYLRSRLGTEYPYVLKADNNMITVNAIAPVPCVDAKTAIDCSSFITCVINNSDIVPRASSANVIMGLSFLKTIRQALEKKKARPTFSVTSWIRYIQTVRSREAFVSLEEIRMGMEKAWADARDDFDQQFLPGKVVHMYTSWTNDGEDKSADRVKITDGKSKVLLYPEFDERGRWLSDHDSAKYLSTMQGLIDSDPVAVTYCGNSGAHPEDESCKELSSVDANNVTKSVLVQRNNNYKRLTSDMSILTIGSLDVNVLDSSSVSLFEQSGPETQRRSSQAA